MTWSFSDLPSGLSNATANGTPFFIGNNEARKGTWKWQITDAATVPSVPADWSVPDKPTTFLHDDYPWTGTRAPVKSDGPTVPFGSTIDTRYLYADFSANPITFDTIYVKTLAASDGPLTFTFKVASDSVFSSRVSTIATVTTVPEHSRFVVRNLTVGSSDNQILKDVPYLQVTVTNSDSNEVGPEIGQIFLGRRRVLNRQFSGAFDDDPRGVESRDFISRAGARTRYVYADCFQDYEGTYAANTAKGRYSLNDETTIRSLYDDCKQGTKSVIYIPNGISSDEYRPHKALQGYISETLSMPRQDGPHDREWVFDFQETAPFQCADTTDSVPPESEAETFITALSLNGTDGTGNWPYLTKDNPTLASDLTSLQHISMFAWVKLFTRDGVHFRWWRNDNNGLLDNGFTWEIGDLFGAHRQILRIQSGQTGLRKIAAAEVSDVWPAGLGWSGDGNYHMHGWTFDGTLATADRVKFYFSDTFNGGSGGDAAPSTFQNCSTPNRFEIGSTVGSRTPHAIAEMYIFDKTLTQTDITALYNNGTPVDPRTAVGSDNVLFWFRGGDESNFPATWDANVDTIVFSDGSGNNEDMTAIGNTTGAMTQASLLTDVP